MKRRNCKPEYADGRPRTDGQLVHVTGPIRDGDGRVIGHTCPCGRVVNTAAGGQSMPMKRIGLARIVPTKAHKARVKYAHCARKLARKAGAR